MRIASVSDLHIDHPANLAVLVEMASVIHAGRADVVLVAGDVSHVDSHILGVIRSFQVVAEEVVYVPGNHELWQVDGPIDSWRRYRDDLRALVEDAGAHYLPTKPFVSEGVAICGTCGWYDHSFLLPEIAKTIDPASLERKTLDGMTWSDVRYVAFRDAEGRAMTDAEVADVMKAELSAQLDHLNKDPLVRSVLAVTHHLAFSEAVQRTHSLPWEFFNAFMGSRSLGDVIRRCPKVRAAVYGHTHEPGQFVVDGIRVVGSPLGYPMERRGKSVQEIAKSRVAWIDLF
ncbi:MAG: metallophosphoesterase [Myxococcota bacterium]